MGARGAGTGQGAGRTVEELVDELRRRGGRVTTARRVILTALAADPTRHLSADDLAREVQRDHPDTHLATIYRNLDALSDMGLVQHVHLGHGPAAYHLAEHDHGHLQCSECGSVIGLDDEVVAQLATSVDRRHGFALDGLHFALTGRCADCRGGA